MKWLIIAVLIIAQQPAKTPKGQGTTEGKGAQVSKQSDRGDNQSQPSKQTPLSSTDNQHPAAEIQNATPNANNDVEIQGKIKTFTGLLVIVGFLQFFALIGQVVIYCRQAKIMARQAHEMKRSRSYMRLQWKAMGIQATHMEGQLTEMQESRKIENRTLILQYRPKIIVRNVKALNFSFELGEPGECELRFLMVNTGGSPAHILPGSYIMMLSLIVHEVGKAEMKEGDRVMLSEFTLQPGQQVTIQEVLPTGAINDLEWANFREGLKTEPSRYLYVTGTVYYSDDLKIPRATGITRKYDPKTSIFEPNKESEEEYSD